MLKKIRSSRPRVIRLSVLAPIVITLIVGVFAASASAESEPFNPITDIIEAPTRASAGIPLTLFGTVLPADATNQTIAWSVKDAGLTGVVIEGDTLTASAAGKAVVTATVADGLEGLTAAFAPGQKHTLALMTDGSLWGFGINNYGQLGNGVYSLNNDPMRIGTENDWASVSTGVWHTLALKTDGRMYAWGYDYWGEFGNGATGISHSPLPVRVGTETGWTNVAAGYEHSLALKANGSLWAWGRNSNGELGTGVNSPRNYPVQLQGVWDKLAAGYFHTLALRPSGSLYVWGDNDYGKLGDGTTVARYTPVWIKYDEYFSDAAASYFHSIALNLDGSLWAWGRNHYGQLGDGTTTDIRVPLRIGAENDWAAVAAGEYHTLALKTDGSLWAWGRNNYGQLGDGTTLDSYEPLRVGAANDWEAVAAGGYHTLARKTDGSLWAWGLNDYGQLGDCTRINRPQPTEVVFPAGAAGYRAYTKDFIITVSEPDTITLPGRILYQPSPLPAYIELFSGDDLITSATTNAEDGAYTLTASPETGYTLKVTKRGYLSYSITNFTIQADEDLPTIDITQLAGDVNGDGIVNSIDLTYLLSEFNRTPQQYPAADIDGDGIVNSVDLTYLLAGFNKSSGQ